MQQYNKMIQKIINFDDVTKENIKELNANLPKNSCSSIRLLIVGGSGKQIHDLI